ncbi:GmrSD restriction endonuclease domain-containing protein [Yinghuangia aomiensis]
MHAEGSRDGYSRTQFKHWIDADRDGCDTRAEILLAEATLQPEVTGRCTITAKTGQWWSWYDETTQTDKFDVDIDHMVPLGEAWDSGAAGWTAAERQAYANDLGDERSLAAVHDSTNQSKADRDPAEWMPPATSATCRYLTDWVVVKTRWGLSVDDRELAALTSGSRPAATTRTPPSPAPGSGDPPPAGPCATKDHRSARPRRPPTTASESAVNLKIMIDRAQVLRDGQPERGRRVPHCGSRGRGEEDPGGPDPADEDQRRPGNRVPGRPGGVRRPRRGRRHAAPRARRLVPKTWTPMAGSAPTPLRRIAAAVGRPGPSRPARSSLPPPSRQWSAVFGKDRRREHARAPHSMDTPSRTSSRAPRRGRARDPARSPRGSTRCTTRSRRPEPPDGSPDAPVNGARSGPTTAFTGGTPVPYGRNPGHRPA